jgi:hypothetical protein
MTSAERLIAYGAILAMLVIGVPWYFEHRGAAECKADDKALVTKTEVKNQAAEVTQKTADTKAGATLDASLHDPIGDLPPIPPSVHQACPSAVPTPRANSSLPAPVLRTPAAPSVVQPDWHVLELGDVQGAHNADAEVTYLHSLLEAQYKLCGGKT